MLFLKEYQLPFAPQRKQWYKPFVPLMFKVFMFV